MLLWMLHRKFLPLDPFFFLFFFSGRKEHIDECWPGPAPRPSGTVALGLVSVAGSQLETFRGRPMGERAVNLRTNTSNSHH